MSIPDFINKIKRKTNIDKSTVLFLFIIIGVALCSFGLGRFSMKNNFNSNLQSSSIGKIDNLKIINRLDDNNNIPLKEVEVKRYVASKNGKMYYSLGCSGAKRIKKENEVWFSNEIDAEKSGYKKSSTCK